jgi:hypothetical protein
MRGYIRAWDTARSTRCILDIQPAENLSSWAIKMVKIAKEAGQKCTFKQASLLSKEWGAPYSFIL